MKRFANMNWSPKDYAASAAIAEAVGQELLSRLQWLALQPTCIVDVGCGTGEMSVALQSRYPEAQVIAVDHSDAMITHAAQQHRGPCWLADAGSIPVAEHSVDLIFANLVLPWQEDMTQVLQHWCALLKPEGVLILSALGPDTLKEWSPSIDAERILPQCVDMHDYGDLLLHTGFVDPVLDVDYFNTIYSDPQKLCLELQHTGMIASSEIVGVPMSPDEDGRYDLTYEIIFAHAFAPALRTSLSAAEEGMVKIPVSSLRAALKKR